MREIEIERKDEREGKGAGREKYIGVCARE